SMSAIELLDIEELEAVIAHELAHFTREPLVIGRICLALRFLMFYNPVALLVYHRINNDTEKLCDDLAVSFTGKRLALVSGLLKILKHTTGKTPDSQSDELRQWHSFTAKAFENQAHLALAKERAERILHREEVSIGTKM
ncbi:MAG: peptidase BlaR1, partial [Bacteroidetes bacterium]|nr:peptidase BlaR1 [Bacteroidota bacterium]